MAEAEVVTDNEGVATGAPPHHEEKMDENGSRLTVSMKQVREAYPALMQLSSYQEDPQGSVRNFLRGQPKAKRAVVKLLNELRPLHEGSEERVADLRDEHSEERGDERVIVDQRRFRDDVDAHLKETVGIDCEPLRSSLLAESAYADLPAHLEHVLGVFYVDDRELGDA